MLQESPFVIKQFCTALFASGENRIINLNKFSLGCVQIVFSFCLVCLFFMQQFLHYFEQSEIKLIKPKPLKPVIIFSRLRIRRHYVIKAFLKMFNYLVFAIAP